MPRCRMELSLTGEPELRPPPWDGVGCSVRPLVLLGPLCDDDRCGIVSGEGCSDPIEVRPASEALPALLRA